MVGETGFSAYNTSTLVASGATGTAITGWEVDDPFYGGIGFDASNGIYTVPETGRYSVKAVINYSTTAAITAQLSDTIPAMVLRRDGVDVLHGNFGVLNVNILVLNVKVMIGSGQVIVEGDLYLNEDDELSLHYVTNGATLGVSVNLGSAGSPSVWSVHRIA